MRWLFAGIVLWLLAASGSAAQTDAVPSPAEIEVLVRSPRAVDVVWGAYWTGQLKRTALIPDLIARLESPPSGIQPDRELAEMLLLDALIQLDAFVPAQVVRPHYERWPIQTLVLWGRAITGRGEILLELLPKARGSLWFALANLLVQSSSSGVAQALVRLPLTLDVDVTDGSVIGGLVGGIGPGMAGDEGQPTKPFPPVPEYRLTRPGAGRIVLSTGPRTLYYERSPVPVWRRTGPGGSEIDPTPPDRVAYLAEAAGTTFAAAPVITIAWTSDADFGARVRTAVRDLRDEYDRVFRLLIDRALLDPDEARAMTSVVEAQITDRRKPGSAPLPPIGPLRR